MKGWAFLKVTSIDQLRELADSDKGDGFEGFIVLAGGLCRSSFRCWHLEGRWDVYHEIDGSESHHKSDEQLLHDTNIGQALENGCLYSYTTIELGEEA